MDRVPPDRGLDPSPSLHDSPNERDVLFLNLAIVKLARKLLVRGVVFRDHHHAGGTSIQAVHDAGPQLTTDPAEIGQVMEQGVDERAGSMARRGMYHHAGWFVEHGEIRILVKDIEGERLGFDVGGLRREEAYVNTIALMERQVGAGGSPGDADAAVHDQLLDLRPRVASEVGDEKAVKTLALVFGRDRNFMLFHESGRDLPLLR